MFKRITLFLILLIFSTSSSARFISEDAHEGEQSTAPSLHRYLYAYQNPTAYVDPDGNFSLDAHTEMSEAAIKQARRQQRLSGKGSNYYSGKALEYGVRVGSTEPDLSIKGSVPYQVNRAIDRVVPDEFIRDQYDKTIGRAAKWVSKKKDAAIERLAPEAHKTFETGKQAWGDSDSGAPIANKLDEHFPNLNIKDSYLYQSHYGDKQFKHSMGKNTAKVIGESVDGILVETQQYWQQSERGDKYAAGRSLGNALHTIQDSFSEGHVARGPDGRIRKTFDFNGQSPELHSHDDEVNRDHPSRKAALDASSEYLRLAEQHRGNPDALRESLQQGIFAPDIDESIPQPNQIRVTIPEAQKKAIDYIESKRNNNEE